MKNVSIMMRSTLIPIIAAASRSCAVARMALPSREWRMNRCRPTISGAVTASRKISLVVNSTCVSMPIRSRRTLRVGKMSGYSTWLGPFQFWAMLANTNEAPTAVIKGARRGARRSGL